MNSFLDMINTLTENAKMYNVDDKCNVITDKFDFTKKADLDKLKESVEKLRDTSDPIVGMIKIIAGDEYEKTLDNIVSDAQKIYDNSQKTRKEVDKSTMCKCEARPSDKVAEEMKSQICKLVSEYMNNIIIPNYKNITSEQAESIHNALFEFACWIYSK